MSQLDQVAAAKAALEMAIMENQGLLDHFSAVIAQLEAMESMSPEDKHEKLKALENDGAFHLNGIDVRRFQTSTGKPLPPKAFLRRTRRRLTNTLDLLRDLLQRKAFPEGSELAASLGNMSEANVDDADSKKVVAFRDQVESLRNSPEFLAYMDVRKAFLKSDPEFRAQAEYVQTKEQVAEGQEVVQARGDELEQMKDDMEKGKITPADLQDALDDLPPLDEPPPAS
jgi:hypothetical protein